MLYLYFYDFHNFPYIFYSVVMSERGKLVFKRFTKTFVLMRSSSSEGITSLTEVYFISVRSFVRFWSLIAKVEEKAISNSWLLYVTNAFSCRYRVGNISILRGSGTRHFGRTSSPKEMLKRSFPAWIKERTVLHRPWTSCIRKCGPRTFPWSYKVSTSGQFVTNVARLFFI